jgi:hypothetical protein
MIKKLRALGVLAGFIAALAVTAAPASAWFYAPGQQWKGPVKITNSGIFAYGEATNKAEVKCVAKEIEGLWSIQTKGQIKDHENQETGKQVQTKWGPHLTIQIKTWGSGCKAKIGGASEIAAEVKPCRLQAVDPQKGSTTATGGVETECVIKAGNCELHVPAGMEKEPGSGEGINVGLHEIKFENSGNNLLGKINVTGVHAEKQPNTPGCPLLSGAHNASLSEVEGTLEGVNQM